jgi:NCS1 family nucleobase:cation symporter-1
MYGRWNMSALVALVCGVSVALIGLVVPALRVLYDYAWFVGFASAFGVYAAMETAPAQRPHRPDPLEES